MLIMCHIVLSLNSTLLIFQISKKEVVFGLVLSFKNNSKNFDIYEVIIMSKILFK